MPLLELKGVSAGYGRSNVLHGIDIRLHRGEIVTLVGANGAGKSTLVKVISGLLRPRTGEVLLGGQIINRLTPAQRLKGGIAHVPEGRQVFAGMTVAENLDLGAHAISGLTPASRAARLADVRALFPILGERASTIAGNLSGGQQQMLAMARGLMSKPQVLLLDEPSLGIAPLLVAEIFRLLTRLRDRGISILLAEQNAHQALSIADRGYVFENGAIALAGSGAELAASPEIAKRYLGVGLGNDTSVEASAGVAERLRACVW